MSSASATTPFPGLRPFETNEGYLFFGREGQSEELFRRLLQVRLLAVIGTSGSGKSSLVRAGLIPYLNALPVSHWRVATFRPAGNPIASLTDALNSPDVIGKAAENAEDAARDRSLLEARLRRSGLGLVEVVRLARLPEGENVLVVVDQFEELFRFVDSPHNRDDGAAFIKLILEAARQTELPIYVALTMRSDFIGDCSRFHDLPENVAAGLYLIARMTREQRRAAIEEPVHIAGGTISRRLTNRVLNDVGDDPDQLPIMQHALRRTWDYWKKRVEHAEGPMDLEDYLAIGGMAEALSRHANEAFNELDDKGKDVARRMFQCLTEKETDSRQIRRATEVATLAKVVGVPVSELAPVIEEFRRPDRSFLMPAQPAPLNDETRIDISHESLIRRWDRLAGWAEEEAQSATMYRRLEQTAVLHEQHKAGLWGDPDLADSLAWQERSKPTEAWADRYGGHFAAAIGFLGESRAARNAAVLRGRRIKRFVWFTAVCFSIFVAGFTIETFLSLRVEWSALRASTDMADSLVFDLGQNPRMSSVPDDLRSRIFDRAVRGYTGVIAINRGYEAAYLGRGAAYAGKGDLDHAIADYTQAITLEPKDAFAYYDRGIAYHRQGDLDHAITDYTQAIEIDSKYAHAYNNRGIAYRAKGDLDDAIADYAQVITIDPKDAQAFDNRGGAYLVKGVLDRAMADYAKAGNAYYDQGDYDQAIADYTQAIVIDLKNAGYYNSRGNAYYEKRDYDRAIADYTQAIALDPKNAAYYKDRGNAYYDQGAYDHAIADYTQAIALDPKYTVAYNSRGYAYRTTHDFDHAIADYTQALALDPKNAIYYNARGNVYYEQGDHDRAITDYMQAIILDPKYAVAYNNRGYAYRTKRDFEHAIADYTQAIAIDPKNAPYYNNRGIAYYDQGDYDRAITDYTQAIALDPKYPVAYNNRGDAYLSKSDCDRAIVAYTQAIALDPKYAIAYRSRGDAYRAKGDLDHAIADYAQAGNAYFDQRDYDHAISDYTQVITLNPKNVDAYNNRGRAYYAKDDYDRAIADYTQAITVDSKYKYAYDNRGDAYKAKGDLDRAIADYTQAIAIDPKNAVYSNDRGNAYYDQGAYDRAIADYTQAIALDPKDAIAYRNRGLTYYKKGDFDRATADYSQSIESDPKYASAYRSRGNAYRDKDYTDYAVADYTQAIALDPKNASAYFERALVSLYGGSLPKALADLNQSSELDLTYPYAAIWLEIVDKRSNLPSRLAQAIKQVDMTKWPAPVIRLYLGQLTPKEVFAAADNPDANTKKGQVCEANFYSGELSLQQGNNEEATRLFRDAATNCPYGFDEWWAARAELRALGENL